MCAWALNDNVTVLSQTYTLGITDYSNVKSKFVRDAPRVSWS